MVPIGTRFFEFGTARHPSVVYPLRPKTPLTVAMLTPAFQSGGSCCSGRHFSRPCLVQSDLPDPEQLSPSSLLHTASARLSVWSFLKLPRQSFKQGSRWKCEGKQLALPGGTRREILKDVSGVFPAGTLTAIIGASGSGKVRLHLHTLDLADLISLVPLVDDLPQRFFAPYAGTKPQYHQKHTLQRVP